MNIRYETQNHLLDDQEIISEKKIQNPTITGSTKIKWKNTSNITKLEKLAVSTAVRKIIAVTNVRNFIQHSKGNNILKKTIAASTARQQTTQYPTVVANFLATIVKEGIIHLYALGLIKTNQKRVSL